jgi:hypothetical protein
MRFDSSGNPEISRLAATYFYDLPKSRPPEPLLSGGQAS